MSFLDRHIKEKWVDFVKSPINLRGEK